MQHIEVKSRKTLIYPHYADVGVELEYGIKVLAIGNSFSVDALQYLYNILAEVGYDSVTIGHLTIGGSSLQEAGQPLFRYGKYFRSIS